MWIVTIWILIATAVIAFVRGADNNNARNGD